MTAESPAAEGKDAATNRKAAAHARETAAAEQASTTTTLQPATSAREPIIVTLITNTETDQLTGASLPLTKAYRLDVQGRLEKSPGSRLKRGRAERRSVRSIRELVSLYPSLAEHQAVTYGVLIGESDTADIVTKAELRNCPGAIARDREHFAFRRAPTVLMLDYDPPAGEQPLAPDELRQRLIGACPPLERAPMLALASASSFIYHAESGKELRGLGECHLYVVVADGTDIPRAGRALYEHLWRIGAGRLVVSKSGELLDRSLIDAAVWQPERLDFAAGAACEPPLQQRRPPAQTWNADAPPFDSRLIQEPEPVERIAITQRRDQAHAAALPKAERARTNYIEQQTHLLSAERQVAPERAREIIREALENQHITR